MRQVVLAMALLVGLSCSARAQVPNQGDAGDAALTDVLGLPAGSIDGQWSSGDCRTRWYMWRVTGSRQFPRPGRRIDVERVVETQPGGFVTQSIAANHRVQGVRWQYLFLAPGRVRVENLSNGHVFFQAKCFGDIRANAGLPPAVLAGPAMPRHKPPVGPSFDCDLIRDPIGITICGDDDLARIDMELLQAYYALRAQSSDDQRQQLKAQATEFHTLVLRRCGLRPGSIPDLVTQRRARPCIAELYRAIRARFLQALSPDALDEAERSFTDHIALQTALATGGFLAMSGPADGIYGSATRDAIMRFQQARGLPVTGFMSAATAHELTMAPAVAAPVATPIAASPALPPISLQRRGTPAMHKLGADGQMDDLLILANVSSDAPNAALDLAGAPAFPSGRAILCFGPNAGQAFDDTKAVARWLHARKVVLPATPPTCSDMRFAEMDGVLVRRASVGRLDPELFNDIAERLQAGTARAFVVLSGPDRQDARDRREVARAAAEQAVAAGKPGFGYAVLANSSNVACVVAAADEAEAWTALLQQRQDDIEADLGRPFQPKVMVTDADAAYMAGRRGACGIIVAAADRLGPVFKAFDRDQVKGAHGSIWFAPDAVQNVGAKVQASRDTALQAMERARQSAAQEQELRAARARAEGTEREARTRQLRATYEANAASLRDLATAPTLALFKDPSDGSSWVPVAFGDVAAEAARRAHEGWVFVGSSSDVIEYGHSKWDERSLETGVIEIRIKLKNADAGKYDEVCYDLAFQHDTEFKRVRSAQSFACDAPDQVKRWLAGLVYVSNWNAP